MSKHTPGPWRHDGLGVIEATIGGHRRQVACATGDAASYGDRDVPARDIRNYNASLIAASPEMFEVLRVLVYWHDEDGRIDESWWQEARDVLAKAKGGAK